MKSKNNKKETFRKLILENCEDREIMDYINKISFPFTTKYLKLTEEKEEEFIKNEIEKIRERKYRETLV